MRKWKQGVIAVLLFFFSLALIGVSAESNLMPTLGVISIVVMMFSTLYALGLVVFFVFQQTLRWSKRKWAKLKIEEKVVKTRMITVYECGHCKMQYSNSQTCPHCGSPHRKTVEEKTEEETVEKWKTT